MYRAAAHWYALCVHKPPLFPAWLSFPSFPLAFHLKPSFSFPPVCSLFSWAESHFESVQSQSCYSTSRGGQWCPFSTKAVPAPVPGQCLVWNQFLLFRRTKNHPSARKSGSSVAPGLRLGQKTNRLHPRLGAGLDQTKPTTLSRPQLDLRKQQVFLEETHCFLAMWSLAETQNKHEGI